MQEIKLNIPEGCKAVTVKVDGGKVITEFEPKEEKWKPKDGDILFCDKTDCTSACVVIYAGVNEDGAIKSYSGLNLGNGKLTAKFNERGFGFIKEFRPATEEEKQRLLDALAKEGYRWTPDKKELEELPRWRAEANQNYFFITSKLEVGIGNEVFDSIDNARYNSCNYFRTREAAECVAEQIREIFKNSKAE